MVFGKKTKTAKTAAPAKPARARRAAKPKPKTTPVAPVEEQAADEFAEKIGKMIYPDHDEEW